ncbi:MAG: hypothetical protein GYB64_09860 [Chloroflexi bacterium]|nr:hypothetical protein [Chloroflexota bacterium]
MPKRIQGALIGGIVGFILVIPVGAFIGLCGPGVGLVSGAIAGFLAVNNQTFATKGDAARDGAIAGGITGVGLVVGQMIAAIIAIAIQNAAGTIPGIGSIDASDPAMLGGALVGGLAVALCFGLVGAGLAAGVGAGVAALTGDTTPTVGSGPDISTGFSGPPA